MGKLAENGKQAMIDEIGLTQRRVDQLIEHGVLVAGGDNVFDFELNLRRYRAYKARDFDYVARELGEASAALEVGLKVLRAETNLKKRRQIEKREAFGANVGRLDRAFLLGNAMAPEGHRPLLSIVTNQAVGAMIGEYCELLGVEINDDKSKT